MTDYNFLMESRLSPAQFQLVNELSRTAYGEGINLYLVGGAVRDMTFGQAVVRDLDFAVEGNIHRVLRHLLPGKPKGLHTTASTWAAGQVEIVSSRIDDRRGSAELWFTSGVRAEITQCHQEIPSAPGRPPEIRPAMIFEDLKCRDFAFNAMAISLHPNSRGLLLDPKNGAGDLERQEIRALHSRSFWDDPVRIYRLFRFGLRFGFKVEEKTQRWLEAALEERIWSDLPAGKQAGEIEAVLREDYPEKVLKLYQDRGILLGLDRNLTRIAFDRFRKIIVLSRKSPGEDVFLLNFDCLVSKMNTSQRQRLAKKVLIDPKLIKLALNLDREAKKMARLLSSARCGIPSQAYKLLSQQPRPLLLYLLAYYPQAKIQSRIKNYLVKAPQLRAHLPETELLVLGVKPGPKFDKILERIFLDQLDGKIKTHQQLVQELRSLAGIKEPPAPPVQPARSGRSAKPTTIEKIAEASKQNKPAAAATPAKLANTPKAKTKHAKAGTESKPAGVKRTARVAEMASATRRKPRRGRG
ncbi:MAG TPA: hypothetical protein VFQ24_07475 [Terriglobia bacterium]|nr:hypothetical protein [Terriglobia bacterium]